MMIHNNYSASSNELQRLDKFEKVVQYSPFANAAAIPAIITRSIIQGVHQVQALKFKEKKYEDYRGMTYKALKMEKKALESQVEKITTANSRYQAAKITGIHILESQIPALELSLEQLEKIHSEKAYFKPEKLSFKFHRMDISKMEPYLDDCQQLKQTEKKISETYKEMLRIQSEAGINQSIGSKELVKSDSEQSQENRSLKQLNSQEEDKISIDANLTEIRTIVNRLKQLVKSEHEYYGKFLTVTSNNRDLHQKINSLEMVLKYQRQKKEYKHEMANWGMSLAWPFSIPGVFFRDQFCKEKEKKEDEKILEELSSKNDSRLSQISIEEKERD